MRLCDAASKPVEGYGASDPVSGDHLRHVVTWGGRKEVTSLAGKPVMLVFEMNEAELFAFAFRKD